MRQTRVSDLTKDSTSAGTLLNKNSKIGRHTMMGCIFHYFILLIYLFLFNRQKNVQRLNSEENVLESAVISDLLSKGVYTHEPLIHQKNLNHQRCRLFQLCLTSGPILTTGEVSWTEDEKTRSQWDEERFWDVDDNQDLPLILIDQADDAVTFHNHWSVAVVEWRYEGDKDYHSGLFMMWLLKITLIISVNCLALHKCINT